MPVRVYRMWPEYATIAEMESRAKERLHEVEPADDGDEPYAPRVDDGLALMSLPHARIGPVMDIWPRNLIFRTTATGTAWDVLYHPLAFVCTSRFRDGISKICGGDVGWLPVKVEPIGEMYIFHPIRSVRLGPAAKYKGGSRENIAWIDKYDFEDPTNLPLCFLIPQPPETPSGKAGGSTGGIYVTDQLRNKMWAYRGIDFACVFERP